jgi:hypothetical protein
MRLAMNEARSWEEAKCSSKVYSTTIDEHKQQEDAQVDAFQLSTPYRMQQRRFQ